MKKLSAGASIVTAIFTGVTVFLCFYFFPDTNLIIKSMIAGLSALIGQLIGDKLFPKISKLN